MEGFFLCSVALPSTDTTETLCLGETKTRETKASEEKPTDDKCCADAGESRGVSAYEHIKEMIVSPDGVTVVMNSI